MKFYSILSILLFSTLVHAGARDAPNFQDDDPDYHSTPPPNCNRFMNEFEIGRMQRGEPFYCQNLPGAERIINGGAHQASQNQRPSAGSSAQSGSNSGGYDASRENFDFLNRGPSAPNFQRTEHQGSGIPENSDIPFNPSNCGFQFETPMMATPAPRPPAGSIEASAELQVLRPTEVKAREHLTFMLTKEREILNLLAQNKYEETLGRHYFGALYQNNENFKHWTADAIFTENSRADGAFFLLAQGMRHAADENIGILKHRKNLSQTIYDRTMTAIHSNQNRFDPLVNHRNPDGTITENVRFSKLGMECRAEELPPLKTKGISHSLLSFEITSLARGIYGYCPVSEGGLKVREVAKASILMADYELFEGHQEDAKVLKDFAKTALDIMVGFDPVTGFVRSSYELIVGKNLITGDNLTKAERVFAAVGLLTLGTGNTANAIKRGIQHLGHYGSRYAPNAIAKATRAIQRGEQLIAGARDIVHHNPISEGVLHSMPASRSGGPESQRLANTFRSGSYIAYTTRQETTLYRVGTSNYRQGAAASYFWTRQRPLGRTQAMIDSALDRTHAWGPSLADLVVEIRVPAGTQMFEGVAASLQRTGTMMSDFVGGGNQVVLLNAPETLATWVQRIGGF